MIWIFRDAFKSTEKSPRKRATTVVVCDEKIEVRQESIDALSEARDNLSPVVCNPEDPRCFKERLVKNEIDSVS